MITVKNVNDTNFKLALMPVQDHMAKSGPSTFVFLKHMIDKGISFGDDCVDELIYLQGTLYEEEGITDKDTMYKLINVTPLKEHKQQKVIHSNLDFLSFMRIVKL